MGKVEMHGEADVNDTAACLHELGDALPKGASVLVVIRLPDTPELDVRAFGRGEKFALDAFTDLHVAAAQLLDQIRDK